MNYTTRPRATCAANHRSPQPKRQRLGGAWGLATPLPWSGEDGWVIQSGENGRVIAGYTEVDWDDGGHAFELREADTRYIALAANMAPRLIDEVERLRSVIAQVREWEASAEIDHAEDRNALRIILKGAGE